MVSMALCEGCPVTSRFDWKGPAMQEHFAAMTSEYPCPNATLYHIQYDYEKCKDIGFTSPKTHHPGCAAGLWVYIGPTWPKITVRSLQWRIMGVMASQITSLTIIYSTVCSGAGQRIQQSSTSLAFGRGIHRWPVNFPTQIASNAENVSIWWRHHIYHQPHHCLLNRLFRRRSKNTSKLHVTGFWTGNWPVTGEFPHTNSQ